MKYLYPLLFSVLVSSTLLGQNYSLSDSLYKQYEIYEEESIQERRFQHKDIAPLIEELSSNDLFEVKQVGESVEERPIFLIRLGEGETTVLLWSQMHGNESTATMALFDLFNFFKEEQDSFSDFKKNILNQLSMYFIPMLNPDGAEKFQRRNALGIDVNRDALRLTSPEANILKSVRDSLDPEFGFNLHDQSVYYTSGRAPEAATISFLAPAYDFEQSENEVRTRAMQLIGYLNPMLQQYIPNGVAKYSDEHEPRAFGDMIQKWGTSTILIESGGYKDDPEKQYIRKLNFVTLLTAFEAIAGDDYKEISVDDYYQIPENKFSLTDLIIRNANMIKDEKPYLIDVGIAHQERFDEDSLMYYKASIGDIGDLSTQYGYRELDAEKMEMYPGKLYPDSLQNVQDVQELDFEKLLSEGYTDVYVHEAPDSAFIPDLPVNIISRDEFSNKITLGSIPNLYIKDGDKIRYVIINGFVYDVEKGETGDIRNSLLIE